MQNLPYLEATGHSIPSKKAICEGLDLNAAASSHRFQSGGKGALLCISRLQMSPSALFTAAGLAASGTSPSLLLISKAPITLPS